MAEVSDAELLEYLCGHRLAVVGTVAVDGTPQSALVGVAVTNRFEIIFDTVSTSRKHANLLRDGRASVAFSGPGEKTVQFEGMAQPMSLLGPEDASYREIYYRAWPDGRERLSWPNLVYWRVVPRWLRFSDYDRGPLIMEREFR
jgi:pyridoxine/pyridoxamine 5'-phosphate oxidase